MVLLWIMVGSALGGAARYVTAVLAAEAFGYVFPFGTLIVNVVGSFIIGFFGTLTGPDGRVLASTETRVFVMTGFCGGFTTFSTFSLETLNLLREGEMARAGANIVLSVALCLLAVSAGHLAAHSLNRLKGA